MFVHDIRLYPEIEWVMFMVFNTTFNNISVVSWMSVLLVEDTWIPGENHRPAASHWQHYLVIEIELYILGLTVIIEQNHFLFVFQLFFKLINEFRRTYINICSSRRVVISMHNWWVLLKLNQQNLLSRKLCQWLDI